MIALVSGNPSRGLEIAMDAGFVLSCAASCFAFLALFLRFARSGSRIFDSLSANSYVIYLLHYAFVNWLQYALLPASLPATVKALVVFAGALGLSWCMAATIRRSPLVTRVV
jgi:surface polysaccharide O-acyltransferase-like enzyme